MDTGIPEDGEAVVKEIKEHVIYMRDKLDRMDELYDKKFVHKNVFDVYRNAFVGVITTMLSWIGIHISNH